MANKVAVHRWCVYRHDYIVDFGEHIFPVEKYNLCYGRLTGEGTLSPAEVQAPEPATTEELLLVHTADYLNHLNALAMLGRGALTWDTPVTREILAGAALATGGTILAARTAAEHGLSLHLNGGFHHAFADHGEGFCYFNDVAVAIRVLQRDNVVRRVAVIDLDLHQGNGTAATFRDDPEVFTFSMHDQQNYPLIKPPSDLDIGLKPGTRDDEYLDHVRTHVPRILREHQPELAVYIAGADPYQHDQLGRLKLTMEGLRERDAFLIDATAQQGVPLAILLGGGYAADTDDTVEIHCNTAREVSQRVRSS